MGRKRPRSPVTTTTNNNNSNDNASIMSMNMSAASAMDQQRLLSFAHFTAAVRDAHRPLPSAPLVLPGISHLLNQTSQPPAPPRQRTHVNGEYIARARSSPAAAAPSATSPAASASAAMPTVAAAATMTTEHSSNVSSASNDVDENDDAEVEDKTPWPSASQYHAIFANMHASSIPVYDLGVDPRGVPLHPEFIYSEPVSCMYFLKCAQLLGKGSFGFPRKKKPAASAIGSGAAAAAKTSKKEASKDFEWRKMSFVTGLPKKQPVVRYITATCYSRASDVVAKKKVFRMHAVMLADAAGAGETGEYVLVHIRAGGSKRVGLRASTHEVAPRAVVARAAPVSPIARAALVASPSSSSSPSDRSSGSGARPASPPVTTLASYASQTASTSPHSKKLLHADFGASQHYSPSSGSLASSFEKRALPPSPQVSVASAHVSPQQPQQSTQHQSPVPSRFEHEQAPSMARHPLLLCANALPPLDASKFRNARQVMRDMILQSCRSADEVASYVHCLQEELAALQQQTSTSAVTAISEH